MAKEFATYDDHAYAPGQKSHGLRVASDDLALSGRPKEDPLAELARIIGGTDQFRESLRQNNRPVEEPVFASPVHMPPEAEDAPQVYASPVTDNSGPGGRLEPAFSAAEFQPPVFEEHRWPDISTRSEEPVAPSRKELQWDDLEAELATLTARQKPALPVREQPVMPAPVMPAPVGYPPAHEDVWPDFNEAAHTAQASDDRHGFAPAVSYAPEPSAYAPSASYAPEPAVYDPPGQSWRDDSGQVQHALEGEREAEPYYTGQSHLPDPDPGFEEAAPPRSRRAGMMTIAVVLGVAALGGVGIAGYRAMSGGATKSGEAKVVKADPAPMKVPAPAAVENAKRVQDRLPAGAEQVVSREEQPLTPREQAAQVQAPAQPVGPRVISLSAPRDEAPVEAAPPVDDAPRPVAVQPITIPTTPAPNPVVTPPAMPLAAAPVPRPAAADEPRRVRTLSVGQDGNVRAPAQPAQPAANAPVSLAPAAVAARPAVPAPASQQVAAARPAAPAPAATPATGGGGGFVVQITSQRSDADARAAFASIQRRQPALAGMSPNIKAVDLGDRGTYYRVRVGPMGRDGANDLCQKLKAGGNDCIVQPN